MSRRNLASRSLSRVEPALFGDLARCSDGEGGRTKLIRVAGALRSSLYTDLSNSGSIRGRRVYNGVALLGLAGLDGNDKLGLVRLQRFSLSALRAPSSSFRPLP